MPGTQQCPNLWETVHHLPMKRIMREKIFLFGASGHAKVVIEAARLQGYDVLGLFDDNTTLKGSKLFGCTIFGGRSILLAWCMENNVRAGLVCIGANTARAALAAWLESQGLILTSVVHPHATVSEGVNLGRGSVIMAGAVINVDVVIGANVIVNTGTIVDHDCVVGDHAHLAPGSTLCGGVRIGDGVLLGAGSVVIPGIQIGTGAIIGAGSTVIRNVPSHSKVAGSPSRELM